METISCETVDDLKEVEKKIGPLEIKEIGVPDHDELLNDLTTRRELETESGH